MLHPEIGGGLVRCAVSLRLFAAPACPLPWRLHTRHGCHAASLSRPFCISTAANGAAGAAPPTLPAFEAAPKFAALPSGQQRQIESYLDCLMDWNTRMNLTGGQTRLQARCHPSPSLFSFTRVPHALLALFPPFHIAVRDRAEAYPRHIDDSLALLPAIDACLQLQGGGMGDVTGPKGDTAAVTIVDVGSGAGLPGIVLAVSRPAWRITLLDSLAKRCAFAHAAVAAADVESRVEVECARAEDAGATRGGALRGVADVAVARAVAELRVLAELCLPLVKVGGHWVAAKGPDPGAEVEQAMAAIKALGGELVGVVEVDSLGADGAPRTAVVVRKTRATPAAYPRRPGTPKKQPL
jgi:16S rRNA (guanine(527)-N(7))-methyltransferase RsmG